MCVCVCVCVCLCVYRVTIFSVGLMLIYGYSCVYSNPGLHIHVARLIHVATGPS